MFDAAITSRDRMLVVALAGWGLRAGEVAALHQNQLHLDADDPHIRFNERKNGPGTVATVFGEDVARRHVSRVEGYLFPSERSKTGHVDGTTITGCSTTSPTRRGFPRRSTASPGHSVRPVVVASGWVHPLQI